MPPRLTQSQKDVLSLYRTGLRLIRDKPAENQSSFLLYLRHHFKHPSQGGGIKKKDFSAVDYMIRRGHRMIDQIFREKGVKNVVLPREALEELEKQRGDRRSRKEVAFLGRRRES